MLTGAAADLFRFSTGLDDSAMARLHPGLEKLYRNIPETIAYQLVAEVVKSQACFAGIEVGNKLVFDPFLNPQKSTGHMCPKALLPVLLEINALWETNMEWAESGKEELPKSSGAMCDVLTQALKTEAWEALSIPSTPRR